VLVPDHLQSLLLTSMPLNSPILSGDVSGGLHSTSVDKIKGSVVSGTAPVTGQTLVWDGSQWAPATTQGGGGGANGLTYYLNQGTDADAPTTNLPGTPKQLGRSADAAQTTATTGSLTPTTWTQFAGFVSESTPQDPGSADIPAGLWDFNVWLYGVANSNQANNVRVKVFKYDGSNAPTLLATSAATTIGTVAALVGISVLVPETAMLVTDRIYVTLEAYATGNGHSVTAQFGDGTPSHVHTSLPLVGGTGLWKSVAGVVQSPASLLVDADVASNAAIAQSKIAGLVSDLAGKQAALTTSAPLALSFGGTAAIDAATARANLGAQAALTTSAPLALSLGGTAAIDAATALANLGGVKTADIQIFNTAGTFTWTKPANAKQVVVELVSGGNGGGAGGKGTAGTGIFGGSGGGAGGYSRTALSAAELTEATYTVVVGTGGNGGQPGVVGTGGVIGAGTVGTASSFAPTSTPTLFLARAQSGGTPGQPGGTSAPTTGTGGAPNSNAGGTANITGTGGAGSGSANAPTGGGAGGGVSTGSQAFNGGNGATNPFINTFSAGGGGSTVASGGSATPATTRTPSSLIMNGSGGGGGGASAFASGSGGNGAAGSGYGTGGGGGGATIGSGNGGNGGNGAPGCVIITTYF
jgi:hypothetical protein